MRWSAVGLLALGVLAALGASHMVMYVRGKGVTSAQERPPGETLPPVTGAFGERVVVAARDLEAPTVIEAEAVEVREMAEDEVPAGALSRRSEVVGRVLVTSIEAGEAFTRGLLADPGSGVHVAAALRPGMRAVGVTLAESMEGLVEAGSVVDVLASVEMGGQPVSMTLLQSVVVLSVAADDARGVVLLVDSKQAEALLLVMEQGSVTLALRNPDDDRAVSARGTRLSELPSAPRRPAPGPVATRPAPRQREVVVMKGDQTVIKTVPTEKEDGP